MHAHIDTRTDRGTYTPRGADRLPGHGYHTSVKTRSSMMLELNAGHAGA